MNNLFRLADKEGVISISETSLNTMMLYKQACYPLPESGGILMGRKLIESNDWIVDSVTEPQKSDRRTRYHFFRSKNPHQKALNNAWKRTNGTLGYLGEWHTHPEEHPTPSGTDIHHWKKAMQEFKYDGDNLFFAIVGTVSITIFQGFRSTGEIVKLKPVTHDV